MKRENKHKEEVFTYIINASQTNGELSPNETIQEVDNLLRLERDLMEEVDEDEGDLEEENE